MRIIQKIKSEVEDWVDFAENIWDILKDLWGDIVQLFPWRKPERSHYVPGAVRAPTFNTTQVHIDGRMISFPTLYSGTSAQARMESLGLNAEQYREYLNTYLERAIREHYDNILTRIGEMRFESSLFREKEDPGAPYNKYPIIKTKFLDGYEPNKI